MAVIVGTNSYVTIAEADARLLQYMPAMTTLAWQVADPATQKEPALVTATLEMFDTLLWQGAKVSAAQALEWPRTGVTNAYGNEVSSLTVPTDIMAGQIILAYMLVVDPDLAERINASVNLRRVKAGSVEIDYFAQVLAGVFPHAVWRRIAQYRRGGTGTAGVGAVYGTERLSGFDDTDWTLSKGYG